MSSAKENGNTIKPVHIKQAFKDLDSYLAEYENQGSVDDGWARLKSAIEAVSDVETSFPASVSSSRPASSPNTDPLSYEPPATPTEPVSPSSHRQRERHDRRVSRLARLRKLPLHSKVAVLLGFAFLLPVVLMVPLSAFLRVPLFWGVVSAICVAVRLLVNHVYERDMLTGLPNSRSFDGALRKAVAAGEGMTVVLIDLDRFGNINAFLGRRAGDATLQRVSLVWSKLLGSGQVLARYGGDVFALLLPNSTEQAAILLIEQLRAAVTIGCSAGVTSWLPGESASLVVSRAYAGLYRAKQEGRNRTVLESSRQAPWPVELSESINTGALDVHYQPIMHFGGESESTVGVEALMRWSSNAQPDVTTEGLIRYAEKYEPTAVDLDELVMSRACADASRLQQTFAQLDLTLEVNVSGSQLTESGYADRISSILAATGWPADQMILEISESEFAAESQTAIANLHALRERGVRIAIDDFGDGYSSLGRLATVSNDTLKVDTTFVAAIRSDSPAPPLSGIVSALKGTGSAEEAERQAPVLTELGFAIAQEHSATRSSGVK